MAYFEGNNVSGSSNTDYIRGYVNASDLMGGAGNDVIFGDFSNIFSETNSNSTLASAKDIDLGSQWYTIPSLLVPDTTPYTMVYVEGDDQWEYFSVTVGAGDIIRVDTDFATFDTVLQLFNGSGIELDWNDDATDEGFLSTESLLEYESLVSQTLYIRLGRYNGTNASNDGSTNVISGYLDEGDQTLLLVSVENHAATGAQVIGNDTISGEDGNDVIFAGGGDDVLLGDSGNFAVFGGNDRIYGEDGNDTIYGAGGDDILYGGSGVDLIYGGHDDDVIYGGTGSDTLFGDNGDDELYGGDGNDTLDGGFSNNELFGENGNDILIVNDGSNTSSYDGGSGVDEIRLSEISDGSGWIANLASGTLDDPSVTGDSIAVVNVENVRGSNNDDVIIGDSANNVIEGFGGNDTLSGGDGNDTFRFNEVRFFNTVQSVDGGNGAADKLAIYNFQGFTNASATAEFSTLTNIEIIDFEDDVGSLDITLTLDLADSSQLANNILINGMDRGGSTETLIIETHDNDFDASLYTFVDWGGQGETGLEIFTSDGTVTGSGRGDTITSTGFNASVINGHGGDDFIIGNNLAETLSGGDGNDTITTNNGIDTVFGGAGDDVIIANGDNIDGGNGVDTVQLSNRNSFFDTNIVSNVEVFEIVNDGLSGTNFVYLSDSTFGGDVDESLTFNIDSTENDFFRAVLQLEGADTNVNLSNWQTNDVVQFTTQVILSDTATSLVTVIGTDFADLFNAGDSGFGLFYGGSGDDELTGGAQGDQFFGEAGNDRLFGYGGDDNLNGGSGDDEIRGGDGNDILEGGAGFDDLNGQDGGDIYVVSAADLATNEIMRDTGSSGIDIIRYDLSGTETLDLRNLDILGMDGAHINNSSAGEATLIFEYGNTGSSNSFSGPLTLSGTDAGDNTLEHFEIYIISGFNFDFSNWTFTDFGSTANGTSASETITFYADNGDNYILTSENDILQIGNGDQFDSWTLDGGIGTDRLDLSTWSDTAGVTVDLLNGTTGGEVAGLTISNFENLTGTQFADTLIGDVSDNDLQGGDGDDALTGGAGDDHLDGGAGTDVAIYGLAQLTDYIIFDIGNGQYSVQARSGLEGTDILTNIENIDINGTVYDLASVAGSILTPGNDNYTGTAGSDTVDGLAGNDRLDGGDGDDILLGNAGADILIGGAGADFLDGGTGFDSVDYRTSTTLVVFNVDTGGTAGEANGDIFANIDRYYLSNFNDTVTGSSANEFFYGEDGNDTINGGGGIDRIYGGEGNDIQRGQDGNDTLYGSAGSDQLNGGVGTDVANYSLAISAVTVDLASGGTVGDAAGDTYFGIEAVYGSDFNDTLIGNSSTNELRGGSGDDTLDGSGGNDRLFGGAGADMLIGGSGIDSAYYTTATAAVTVDLILGGIAGDANGDTYSSIEWVFGSDFSDTITADNNANRIYGEDGDDVIFGEGGNDRLLGGEGNDSIAGGSGVDVIFGQNGDDTLTGNEGNDFFYGGAGADSFDGGADFDTVNYLPASSGVSFDMTTTGLTGEAAGDTYVSIERVLGTGFDDSMRGSAGDDILLGNGGNDYIDGGAGNDSLNGGAGVDSFGYTTNGGDADVISGFTTNEVIYVLGGDTAFDTWTEVQAVGADAGANVIFDFGGGNTLTIVGRNLADLDAGNFDFSGTPPAGEPLSDPDAFAADVVDVFDMDALI